MGGQLPASLIYTVETKPRNRWGFYGSLVMVRHDLPLLVLWNVFGILEDNSVAFAPIL